MPCIYANDHFGHWDADFRQVIDGYLARGGASRTIAEALAPHPDDHSVLKPRHSAFFGTPLEFLLDELIGLDCCRQVSLGSQTSVRPVIAFVSRAVSD